MPCGTPDFVGYLSLMRQGIFLVFSNILQRGKNMAKGNRSVRLRDEDRAEMGVGTMLIFISMVLVAAIAASLLIETANKVNQQAQSTGDSAIADVAAGFRVVNVAGDCSSDGTSSGTVGDYIEYLELKIATVAGSPNIPFDSLIIEIMSESLDIGYYFDAQSSYQHEYTDWTSSTSETLKGLTTEGETFTAQELRDPDETFYEITETDNPDYVASAGSLIRVFIDVGDHDIGPQDHVALKIIPKHGVPTYESFEAPATFTTRYIEIA